MAVDSQRDRLLPSLLDRLKDDDPDKKTEPRDFKVLSLRQLRQNVLRDLAWLLNATNLDTVVNSVSEYGRVQRSVINFGMPILSGTFTSSIDITTLQQRIRDTIIAFEPRILPESVVVKFSSDSDSSNHNILSFTIRAQLWAQPAPIELLINSNIDLESGQTIIEESTGR